MAKARGPLRAIGGRRGRRLPADGSVTALGLARTGDLVDAAGRRTSGCPIAASSSATGSSRPRGPGAASSIELDGAPRPAARERGRRWSIPLRDDDATLAAGIDGSCCRGAPGRDRRRRRRTGDAALRITSAAGPLERRGLLPPGRGRRRPRSPSRPGRTRRRRTSSSRRGVRAIPSAVRRDPRSPLAGIKSTSRADYVYARLEATRAGADDALFLTTDGASARRRRPMSGSSSGRTAPRRRRPMRRSSPGRPGRGSSPHARRPRAGSGRGRRSGRTTCRRRRGVPLLERRRDRAADLVRRATDRQRPAGAVVGGGPRPRARRGSTRPAWRPLG